MEDVKQRLQTLEGKIQAFEEGKQDLLEQLTALEESGKEKMEFQRKKFLGILEKLSQDVNKALASFQETLNDQQVVVQANITLG